MSERLQFLSQAESPNVPVIVESIKAHADFRMTRCSYLSIECDSPRPDWVLSIAGQHFPFLMVGLTGIVQQPFGARLFGTVDQIADLFERIGDQANLLIDIDDIWLPNFLFEKTRSTPFAGAVYRVTNRLFASAFLFREGRQELETFRSSCTEFSGEISFSGEETAAFRDWCERQISDAIKQYPKNKRYVLSWSG